MGDSSTLRRYLGQKTIVVAANVSYIVVAFNLCNHTKIIAHILD